MHGWIIHLIICPSVDLLCNCKPLCQPSLVIHAVNVVIQLHIIPLPLYKHHMMVYSKRKDLPIVGKSWNIYTLFTVDASIVKNTMLQSKYTNPCYKQSFTCYMHREGQVNGSSLFLLHSWTRTARLTHGHRILRLAEDFEMLRLTPDFENIASGWRLAGIRRNVLKSCCGSPPGVIVADTLSFNAKMDLVDFWV